MGHGPNYKPFRASFLKGAEVGICVSDPKDAVDDIMVWHGDAAALLAQTVDILSEKVLLGAELAGDRQISAATKLAISLLSITQRQIESAGGALDAIYAQLPDASSADPALDQGEPAIRRAVRFLRAEQRVNEALAVIRRRASGQRAA